MKLFNTFLLFLFPFFALDFAKGLLMLYPTTPSNHRQRFKVLLAKKQRVTTSGSKGFGNTIVKNINTDKSKETRAFYEYLEQQHVKLHSTGLAYFPLSNDTQLRGAAALKDIKKGEEIINIPYEAAINLGAQGDDPTVPAVEFLTDYCRVLTTPDDPKRAYYQLLPGYSSEDCMGSTDRFSDAALEALQSPLIVEETLKRRERTLQRFQNSREALPSQWIDGTELTPSHLQWAVWLVTSRVLTVQGALEEHKSYRLLIPYLDMCNHDRASPHILTGRAVPGGQLKVVAGANIKAGEQINICYGGGVAGNDRFLQDYGFLDESPEAYDIVAQQLMGKRRIYEGTMKGKSLPQADRESTIRALQATSIDHDEAALQTEADNSMRTAIQYRLSLKRALSKYTTI